MSHDLGHHNLDHHDHNDHAEGVEVASSPNCWRHTVQELLPVMLARQCWSRFVIMMMISVWSRQCSSDVSKTMLEQVLAITALCDDDVLCMVIGQRLSVKY